MKKETRAMLDEVLTRSTCNTVDLLADTGKFLDRLEKSALQVTTLRARLRQAGRTEADAEVAQKFGAIEQKLLVMAAAHEAMDRAARRMMDATRAVDRLAEDLATVAGPKGYARPGPK